MIILPAIDLISGQAVRLQKGDYEKKTVYAEDPLTVVRDFKAAGAEYLHLVDLDGAKSGGTDNLKTIERLVKQGGLFTEVGGGIRDEDTIKRYLDLGVSRVILGTAAATNPAFAEKAAAKYGEKVAVGVDVKNGKVAVRGWTQTVDETLEQFCEKMQDMGVKTLIVTDIDKDGMMSGTNREMYERLTKTLTADLIASGGVSALSDVEALRDMGLHGAIIGKAYYTGAVKLTEALRAAKGVAL